jgi:hypothetical protein
VTGEPRCDQCLRAPATTTTYFLLPFINPRPGKPAGVVATTRRCDEHPYEPRPPRHLPVQLEARP